MDACIIFNCFTFMLYYHRCSDEMQQILRYFNTVFIIIFLFEIGSKVYLYKCLFFKGLFNIFELFLLLTAISGIIIESFFEYILQGNRVLKVSIRLLQVLRAVRLAKSFRFVAKMFRGLLYVMPKVAPTLSLLLLTIVIFALFGI